MHLRIAPGTLLALALLGGVAQGAEPFDDRLSRVEAGLDAELARAQGLQHRLAAASGTLDAHRAVSRYQDAVYQFLVGEHEAAAEVFFVLVASGVLEPSGLRREAQWYLGESLRELGHAEIATTVYQDILDEADHPFRTDAVRRLLELYSRSGDPARFDRLFQREIVDGGVAPSDLIVYSVGRALRAKGESARAKAWLGQLPLDSPYGLRARYQIGAMLVQQGDEPALRDAIRTFREVALAQPVAAEDPRVRDLSLLALGRIHDHLGEFGEAVRAYEMIAEDSPHRAEQLHELAWLYIGENSSGLALDAVDRFLAAFPDHRNAAELRLVRAHLLFQRGEWERALDGYDDVATAYGPVRDRFARLARPSTPGGARYLQEVLRDLEPDASADEAPSLDRPGRRPAVPTVEPLPGFALSVMQEDPAFVRALDLWDELGATDAELTLAEHLVEDLQASLRSGSVDELVSEAQLEAVQGRVRALELRLELLDVEDRWLRELGAEARVAPLAGQRAEVAAAVGELVQRVDALLAARPAQHRVAALSHKLGALSQADPGREALEAELAAAKAEAASSGAAEALVRDGADELPRLTAAVQEQSRAHRVLREQAGIDVELDPTSVRIDRLHAAIARTAEHLAHTGEALTDVDATDLQAVHDAFRVEAEAVAQARRVLEERRGGFERIASGVVRRNFQRLADLFAERVLGAEMGAVNVHWSRWVQAGEDRDAAADERARGLAELERAYELLERKLEQ